MRARKNIKAKQSSFVFVVEGETERWYLETLKENENIGVDMRIRPELSHNKNLKSQYELVKKLSTEEYDKVFWIIDLDTILKESNENKKGEKPIDTLIRYKREISEEKVDSERGEIVLIVNNPCFEYWLLLHFSHTTQQFANCGTLKKELKKHLHKYEKTEKFYKKQNNDIYQQLKPRLREAINNSMRLGGFDTKNTKKPMSEMHLLFQSAELKDILGCL